MENITSRTGRGCNNNNNNDNDNDNAIINSCPHCTTQLRGKAEMSDNENNFQVTLSGKQVASTLRAFIMPCLWKV